VTATRYVYAAGPDSVSVGAPLEDGEDLDGVCLDWSEVVSAAGFDPDDQEISITRLVAVWRGHAAGSLVVTGLKVDGHPFAVVA